MPELIIKILLLALFLSQGAIAQINPDEEFPAGTGTTSDFSVQAYSHPLSGTQTPDRRSFTVGNSFFNQVWVASPASTTARDGLGPIYNAVACSACHFKDGRGRGLPEQEGQTDISLLFRLRVKGFGRELIPHPTYGGQLQPQGIPGVPGEGQSVVRYEKIHLEFSDGTLSELLKPVYEFIKMNFGPLGDETIASPRVAPQMIGLGLVEAISEEDILKNEDPYDADGDGISGRANWVISTVTNAKALGRFGWKAGKPSLLEQNAAAFVGDMGITSSLHPTEECTETQTECLKERTSEDIPDDRLQNVTRYTQLLAVPKRRNFKAIEVVNGRKIFETINCSACHIPGYKTGNSSVSVLSNQTIYPYSDFLLHDMGDELADSKEDLLNEDEASTREWRTPPLWGLGLTKTVNGHTRYLHDGRARNLEEAILWHGGEAKKSRDAYMSLNKKERDDLIRFLEDL